MDIYFFCSIELDISNLPLIFFLWSHLNVFGYAGFSDLGQTLDPSGKSSKILCVKSSDFMEDFMKVFWRGFLPCLIFHNRSEHFVKSLFLIFFPFGNLLLLKARTLSNLFLISLNLNKNKLFINFSFFLMSFSLIYLVFAYFFITWFWFSSSTHLKVNLYILYIL